jgi:bifunctional non-homologous end joining protein LigD
MPQFEFCIPTTGNVVPAGQGWFHEVKYDGYRLRVERDGDRVRLITRGGYNWTKRFPCRSGCAKSPFEKGMKGISPDGGL